MKKYITIPKIIKARRLKEDEVAIFMGEEVIIKAGE